MSEPGVTGGAGQTDPEELSEDGVKIGLGDEDNSFEPEEDPDAAPDEDPDAAPDEDPDAAPDEDPDAAPDEDDAPA